MRRIIGTSAGWLFFGLLWGTPIGASAQQASAEVADAAGLSEALAGELRPGEYRWNPDAAPDGPISILISIERQIGYVYRSGILIGITTVSTGKPGHETPTGVFSVLQKKVDHRSTLYDSAPMPFMQRLTWDGIAIHAGRIPGHPASHGCVRVPDAFARLLYGATRLGVEVTIQEEDVVPAPIETALADPQPASSAVHPTSDGVRLAGYSPEPSP